MRLFTLFVALLLPLPVLAAPNIKVAASTHNFGAVLQGTPVNHSFVVENRGSEPLQILKITPDCGCSAAELPSPFVEVGERTKIDVTFNTSGFFGFKRRTFRVFTNDPRKRSVLLTLEGTVRRDIEVNPPRIYFGSIRQGADLSEAAEITVGPKSKAQILDVVPRSEHLEVELDDNADPKKRRVVVRLKPETPLGVFRSRVIVRTSSKKNPIIDIPVFARVEGDLRLEPRTISFGLLEGPLKRAENRMVLLKNSSKRPLQIQVSSDTPSVRATASEILPDGTHRINIEIPPGTSGSIHARVTIKTNHPKKEQRKLTVPVYGIISRKGT